MRAIVLLRSSIVGLVVVSLAACGPNASPSSAVTPSPSTAAEPAVATPSTPGASTTPPSSPTPSVGNAAAASTSAADAFAKLRPDLTACFEEGRKSVPAMTSGKATFRAAIGANGQTQCVVPSEDTGLTQAVEDCMRARFERERHAPASAPWSLVVPVVVKEGVVGPGTASAQTVMLETIESHGLAEDVYDVIDAKLAELRRCFVASRTEPASTSSSRRVVHLGARIDQGGAVACTVVSSESPIASSARECAARTLASARFRAPKRGTGLLSLPIEIL